MNYTASVAQLTTCYIICANCQVQVLYGNSQWPTIRCGRNGRIVTDELDDIFAGLEVKGEWLEGDSKSLPGDIPR